MSRAKTVNELFMDCLYEEKDLPEDKSTPKDAVLAEGLTLNVGFHPEKLKSHRQEIIEVIKEMPDAFIKGKGGGHTFLNLCEDRNGNLWAQHQTMEELVLLAIASELGGYCLPRETWSTLPGGVPYVWFSTK
jgi:hypothetical protein